METSRFKKIIEYNTQNCKRIESKAEDFYTLIGMENHKDLRRPMQLIRTLLENMHYIVVEMPFRDKEIGAFCYNGNALNYVFLNTSLPQVNVNFALCHEVYHIFYQEIRPDQRVELYMNEHYFEHEEESAANLFAGTLLMPEQSYRFMFQKFSNEAKKEDTKLSVLAKLMNYFEVPYVAALIRCYELKLFEAGQTLEELLNINNDDVRDEFARLWLDENVLNASKKDDYARFELMVKSLGEKYREEEYINDRTLRRALQNMRAIYKKIKGE